jgi:DNA-binding NarL/FixJ family response regulator
MRCEHCAAGAFGYLDNAAAITAVVGALRNVLRGEIYVSPQFSERLIGQIINYTTSAADSSLSRLSQRELQVLQLLGRGLGTKEIASRLDVSPKTIESHFKGIKTKFSFKKELK